MNAKQRRWTPGGIPLGHFDHNLDVAHLRLIDTVLEHWDGSFVAKLVQLPEGVPDLFSGLYGPAGGDPPITEDQVRYEERNARPGPSRLIALPPRPVRSMVVIAGPGDRKSGWEEGCLVYTAYGSPVIAPREWWDASMRPPEALEAAKFWAEHALADETRLAGREK